MQMMGAQALSSRGISAAEPRASRAEIRSFYENNSDFTDTSVYTPLPGNKLMGDARIVMNRLTKTWDGYPPSAYTAKVGKGEVPTTFIDEENDGGAYLYVCSAHGKLLEASSQGESGDLNWDDKPSLPDAS